MKIELEILSKNVIKDGAPYKVTEVSSIIEGGETRTLWVSTSDPLHDELLSSWIMHRIKND